MIDISFLGPLLTGLLFEPLWVGLFLTAFASFFVFFAKQFKTFVMGSCLALSGITIQFLGIDIVTESQNGQIIVVGLWFLFLFQIIAFRYALTAQSKNNPLFFFLPFLAFVSMAISTDLLTFALGLTLFNITFILLNALKGTSKENIFISIQKMFVAFLSYAYGMAILFSREGNIWLNKLYLKLNRGNWDNWTTLGVGLILLSIGIELYAIIPLVNKKK